MSRPIFPVCIKCKVEYKAKKNGVHLELMADFGSFELYRADLLECPKCHHQIISGFSFFPFGIHREKGYKELLAKVGKTYKCY